jgi:hypothetical protein
LTVVGNASDIRDADIGSLATSRDVATKAKHGKSSPSEQISDEERTRATR